MDKLIQYKVGDVVILKDIKGNSHLSVYLGKSAIVVRENYKEYTDRQVRINVKFENERILSLWVWRFIPSQIQSKKITNMDRDLKWIKEIG